MKETLSCRSSVLLGALFVAVFVNSLFGQDNAAPPLHRPVLRDGSVRSGFCLLPQRRVAVANCDLSDGKFEVAIYSREGKRVCSAELRGKWDGNSRGLDILYTGEGILLTFDTDVWLLSAETLDIKWHKQEDCWKTLTPHGVVLWPRGRTPNYRILSHSDGVQSAIIDESWTNASLLSGVKNFSLGMPTPRSLVFVTARFVDNRDVTGCRILRCDFEKKSIKEVSLSPPKRRKEYLPKIVDYDERADSVLIATATNTVECWDASTGVHLHSIEMNPHEIEGSEVKSIFPSGDRSVVFANLDGRNTDAFVVGRQGVSPVTMMYETVGHVSSTPAEAAVSFSFRHGYGPYRVYSGNFNTGFVDGVRIGLDLPSSPDQGFLTSDGTIWLGNDNDLTMLAPLQDRNKISTKKIVWRDVLAQSSRIGTFASSGKSELVSPLITQVPGTNGSRTQISLLAVNPDGNVITIAFNNRFNLFLGTPLAAGLLSKKDETYYFIGEDRSKRFDGYGFDSLLLKASVKGKAVIPVAIDETTDFTDGGKPVHLRFEDSFLPCLKFDEREQHLVAGPFRCFRVSKVKTEQDNSSYRYLFYDVTTGDQHTLRLNGDIFDLSLDFSPAQQSQWIDQRFCVIDVDKKVAWWDEPSKRKASARVDDGQVRGDAIILFQAGKGRLGVVSKDRDDVWVSVCSFDADGLVIEDEKKTDMMPDFVESGIGFTCHYNRVTQTRLVESGK